MRFLLCVLVAAVAFAACAPNSVELARRKPPPPDMSVREPRNPNPGKPKPGDARVQVEGVERADAR